MQELINKTQLSHIYTACSSDRIELFLPLLNETMQEFDITTPQRVRFFLAQVGHESGQLRYTEELATGEAYEKRLDLGNTSPGDGVKYKGRGLIQLTGKRNYSLASLALELPLLDNPELLAEPRNASRVSGWFWQNNKLNALCDAGFFQELTRRINGGLNGYPDRYKLLQKAMEVI